MKIDGKEISAEERLWFDLYAGLALIGMIVEAPLANKTYKSEQSYYKAMAEASFDQAEAMIVDRRIVYDCYSKEWEDEV